MQFLLDILTKRSMERGMILSVMLMCCKEAESGEKLCAPILTLAAPPDTMPVIMTFSRTTVLGDRLFSHPITHGNEMSLMPCIVWNIDPLEMQLSWVAWFFTIGI